MPHRAVINSDETGPLISLSEAGDYDEGRCGEKAEALLMNKSMAACSSTAISPPPADSLLRPLTVLSAQPPSTTLTSYSHCCFLIAQTLAHKTQQCCIEVTIALSSR